MDNMAELAIFVPVIFILEILMIVFSLLFMHHSAKQHNYKLSPVWYVCGVVFGMWTLIVFLIKRKDFPGEDFKVCPSCGGKFPVNYEICSQCLVELPVIDTEKQQKHKKLAKIFGGSIIAMYVLAVIAGIVFGAVITFYGLDSLMDSTDRIAVEGVFYDKKGLSYENDEDVLLYDEDGKTYTYTVEKVYNEEFDMEFEESYYVSDDGKKYSLYDCYVTEDGWFYCDKGYFLEYYFPDTENMSEEELDAYYQSELEKENGEYKYYYSQYVDKKGKIYYMAYEASWNEKGELITEENDVSVKE